MDKSTWSEVDNYLHETLLGKDDILSETIKSNRAAGLPSIDVTPLQGKLLTIICSAVKAKNVLEIGTLGGYSTICLARGVGADGKVVTLEYSDYHGQIAKANLERAGVLDRVTVRIGPALETLPTLSDEALAPFDLIFIDADKENNPAYLEWAVKLARSGSLIFIDNVVREGSIIDMNDLSEATKATRRLHEMLGSHPQLEVTSMQTIGEKGWDGFALAMVR